MNRGRTHTVHPEAEQMAGPTHHDTHVNRTLCDFGAGVVRLCEQNMRDEGGREVRLVVSSSRLSNETYEQRELIQLVEDTSLACRRFQPRNRQELAACEQSSCSTPRPPGNQGTNRGICADRADRKWHYRIGRLWLRREI